MKKKRILFVDDEEKNIRILKEILGLDFDIGIACTGEEALEILHSFRPHLILLDVMMPGIDGCEVCKIIRHDSTFSKVPIIMVSAKAMPDEIRKGQEAGANDYITKPFTIENLETKVNEFLAG